jgi:hypothetical protein
MRGIVWRPLVARYRAFTTCRPLPPLGDDARIEINNAQIMDLRRADVVRMGRCDAQCFEWSREIQERDSLRVFGTMFSEEIATPMAANHL